MSPLNTFSKTATVVSSGLVSLFVAVSPGEAATSAISETFFSFSDFSIAPDFVLTDSDVDATSTVITPEDGAVLTNVDAEAMFQQNPAFASNRTVSEAFGEGSNYFGIAESQASVLGQFDVAANSEFSFSFTGFLDLFSAIDDPVSEQAQAAAGITFALLDEAENILSSFELFGNLNTPGDGDELAIGSTPDIVWDINEAEFFSGSDLLTETAFVDVSGSYSQWFADASQLTLLELKFSDAVVAQTPSTPPEKTPEPGILLALLALGGTTLGVKRPKHNPAA